MKLFTNVVFAFCVSAKTDERAYSNYPPFLTDGNARPYWKANDGHIAKYNRLSDATNRFYDTFYSSNPKAVRFAGHMRRLLEDTRTDLTKQVTRCDRRTNRGSSVLPTGNDLTDGWVLPVDQGIKKGYETLFYQFARWTREEIYWDCPRLGMRVFKRLDRLQWLSIYFYCDRVDDSDSICTDTYFINGVAKPKPRKHQWFTDYYGRYSDIAYNGVACENAENGPTELVMQCPPNHDIKVLTAQFGRFNQNACTKNVDKSTLEMCDQFVDVIDHVSNNCDGGEHCNVIVNSSTAGSLKERANPCPAIPKYTRIRWLCDPSDEFLNYGN